MKGANAVGGEEGGAAGSQKFLIGWHLENLLGGWVILRKFVMYSICYPGVKPRQDVW